MTKCEELLEQQRRLHVVIRCMDGGKNKEKSSFTNVKTAILSTIIQTETKKWLNMPSNKGIS